MNKIEKMSHITKQVKIILAEEKYYAFDIGASVELPSHWHKLRKALCFIAVDPDKKAAKALSEKYSDIDYKVSDVGLSEKGGERILYCTASPTGSSLYKIDSSNPYLIQKYCYPITELPILTITFDELVSQSKAKEVNLVKLDTQGSELEILKGLSASYFDKCLGLEIEIGFPGGYIGQPGLDRYNDFLIEKGFEIFDIRPGKTYHKGAMQDETYYLNNLLGVHNSSPTVSRKIWECDILYLKSPQTLIQTKDISLIRKGILTFCIYNFFIEALYTIELLEKAQLLNQQELLELKKAVIEIHSKKEFNKIFSNTKLWSFVRNFIYFFFTKVEFKLRSTIYWSGYMSQGQ